MERLTKSQIGGEKMNNQQEGIWVPLIASVGIGAVAFYSMTRGKGVEQTIQQSFPFVADIVDPNGAPHQQQNQNQSI